MSNTAVAETLARALAEGLIHPGDENNPATSLILPGFRTTGMPEPMAEQINDYAKLISEAIVATIEGGGSAIVPAGELAEIRERLTTMEPTTAQVLRVNCTVCGNFLFSMNVNPTNPTPGVNGPYFLGQLQSIPAECPHTPA